MNLEQFPSMHSGCVFVKNAIRPFAPIFLQLRVLRLFLAKFSLDFLKPTASQTIAKAMSIPRLGVKIINLELPNIHGRRLSHCCLSFRHI